MKGLRRLWIGVPAMALVGLLLVLFWTRGTMEQLGFLRRGGGAAQGLVDQRPHQTAETLAGLAVSAEEQGFAQEALRLADHEVDQAFATALRQAGLRQGAATKGAAELAARVDALKGMVKDDQAKVDGLTAAAKGVSGAAVAGDDLDVAKAQLGLDTDELTDATGDLARATGDKRGEIERELEARQAAMKKGEAAAAGKTGETAVTAVKRHGTLWGRVDAWIEQRSRAGLLAQAEAKAEEDAKALAKEHDGLERESEAAGGRARGTAGAGRVKALQAMGARRVVMSILDDRVQTEGQLAAVYGKWQAQVWVQHRILRYLILESLAWVAFVLLAVGLARAMGRMVVRRVTTDARRARTLNTILTLGVEVVGLLGVLLVVFGAPQQTPTILGLATAGLTVVFQDYILAFCGWFVLMGRNGVAVGDWVEIDSIGGEVTEIGLFRTVLLETGNWTSKGHPTGRRVTFSNSFALKGQFFNFSTHGQWMWDEIKLNVPATANAYDLVKRMQTAVEKETAEDTAQASAEWQKAASGVGLKEFSAQPTVDLRPAAAGVDVVVRFVTRAGERFDLSKRIYDALVGLMEGTER